MILLVPNQGIKIKKQLRTFKIRVSICQMAEIFQICEPDFSGCLISETKAGAQSTENFLPDNFRSTCISRLKFVSK